MEEKSDSQLIKETHVSVIELKTVLLGIPGTADKGLVGKVNDVVRGHRKLSKNFWILVGTLIGTGILGGGIYTICNGGIHIFG